MGTEEFIIPIDEKLEAFKHHLLLNERVILSAKYGEGKTYFLSKFKDLYKEDFFFITLYPIHYSVVSNEDIFEYIKRDILFQLVQSDLLPKKSKINTIGKAVKGASNIKNLLAFLSNIPRINVNALFDEFSEITEGYKDVLHLEERYLASFTSQKGVYENDAYTLCINKILESVNKRTVLIIEDLDRIDPAHLFRLLNVFGAHIDRPFIDGVTKSNNKFGFSNIVSILDYDNAKITYSHFYGNGDSFEGYMRKYFTDQPFRYSIHRDAALKLYDKIREQIKPYNMTPILYDESKILVQKFEELSIRDMERIWKMDVVAQMRQPVISNLRQNEQMSTDQGIFRVFLCLNRIGCNFEEFCEVLYFLVKNDSRQFINVIAPIFFFEETLPYDFIELCDKDGNGFILKEKKDDNNIITLLYSDFRKNHNSSKTYNYGDIWNFIGGCKKKFRELCVMDDSVDESTYKQPLKYILI